MNEWIYRNSLNEYDQKLAVAENERRALQIAKPRSLNQVVAALINEFKPQSRSRVRLQRNS